ncbi:Mur ligase family protein [Streptomyces sanglieri]|uniref:Mur ligase family protein n=1 Tax=Streptomyces sanglieri TaxID=193460 RepID=A0ABW2X7U8_9ACTN
MSSSTSARPTSADPGSREATAQAKGELVQGLAPGGTAVLSADDPRVVAMRSLTDCPAATFGQAEHADVRVLDVVLDRLARPSFTADRRHLGSRRAAARGHSPDAQRVGCRSGRAGGRRSPRWAAAAPPTVSLPKGAWNYVTSSAAQRCSTTPSTPTPTRPAPLLDALAAIEGGRRIAVLGEMLELGDDNEAEHRAIGSTPPPGPTWWSRSHPAARRRCRRAGGGAGRQRRAVEWLRGRLTAGDVVLVKASAGRASTRSPPRSRPDPTMLVGRPMDDR